MDENLWPARNVAEYAYCPRLFYYMEVEGIHLPSEDTLAGVRVHRRVDSPSATGTAVDPAEVAEPKTVRSLTLTSPGRQLTATLDLAEINGYFEHFAGMLKGELAAEFDANGRQRRPAPDPVNSILSFAYSMLAHECTAALRVARLEPSIGAFHVSRPGRPSLSLDLMEPFRPLIADSIAVSAINRGELQAGHFQRTAAGCRFTDSGINSFFSVYGRRMADEITHPVFGYKLCYRRMIVLQARMVAAWLLGEIPTLSFLTTR